MTIFATWPGVQPELEREFARLELGEADGGIDRHAHEAVGVGLGELLDLHAAVRRGDDHDPLGFAVEHEAEIEFARDVGRRLDQHALDHLARFAGLLGHQHPPEQRRGEVAHLLLGPAQLDAAGLAAAAGMDLRLDDPGVAADLAGAVAGLLGR